MQHLLRSIALACLLAACGSTNPSGNPDAGPPLPDAGPPGSCSQGDACSLDGANGLCEAGGLCGACTDTVDDTACADAYGAGYLCVGNECVIAECHDASECGGAECVAGHCQTCAGDADCDGGQVCDAGACVDAATSCTGGAVGDSCGTGDLCCQRSGDLTCVDVECCTSADCSGGDSCQGGTCVPATSLCVAPAAGNYHVDPSYSGVSTGSAACPFKTLHGAFNAVRTDDFAGDTNVIVHGGTINATSEGGADHFPLNVPAHAYVYTPSGTPDTVVIAPQNKTAFELLYDVAAGAGNQWSARLSHFDIQAAAGSTAGDGIYINGGTLTKPTHIDHVAVHGFKRGIDVDTAGKADINWGIDAHDNADFGLYVAGRVDMQVGASADARSHYDHNAVGIRVNGGGVLDLVAIEQTDGLKTVTASNNSIAGLVELSSDAGNEVHNLGVIDNAIDGVRLFTGSKAKLRGLRIRGSGKHGIHVMSGTTLALGGFDLGVLGDAGRNELGNNTDTDICTETPSGGDQMTAVGNTFGAVDCLAGPGTVVDYVTSCAGHGGGISEPNRPSSFAVSPINSCIYDVQ